MTAEEIHRYAKDIVVNPCRYFKPREFQREFFESQAIVRLLFAGNLTRQPYMIGANYRISGDLTNTDNVMNNTFWIGVQPALTEEMLEFAARKIETYLGINF